MAEIDDVQVPVINFARQHGWLVRPMEYRGRTGCPDHWFMKDGRLIIVEFKEIGKEPRLKQAREIGRLRAHGMAAYVIDNVSDGCALFA